MREAETACLRFDSPPTPHHDFASYSAIHLKISRPAMISICHLNEQNSKLMGFKVKPLLDPQP
jgi:hypothetical protein